MATATDFIPPGSLVGKFIDAGKSVIDWRKLASMVDAIRDADASDAAIARAPALGLVLGELRLARGDAEALAARATTSDYGSFALQRTLGMKAVVTRGATMAGVLDTRTRCAIGRTISDSGSEDSLFAMYARRASGDADAFAEGAAEDARGVRDRLSDDDLARTKNWYGDGVGDGHFSFVEAQVRRACEKAANGTATESKGVTVVPILIPSFDAGGNADSNADENATDVELMFGKKSKKKKSPAAAAASSAQSSSFTPTSLAETLAKMASQRVSMRREPTFPEIESWGQTTAAETSGAAYQLIADAPAGSAVIFPSELMRSTLAFDAEVCNTKGARAYSVDQILAAGDDFALPSDVSVALFATFDPDAANPSGAAADAKLKKALASVRKSRPNASVVNAVFVLVPECATCDAQNGPPDAVALAAAASARAHARWFEDDE